MSLAITDSVDDQTLADPIDFSHRYFEPTMPFTLWGHIQILSSALFPPKYEIRTIEDRGALCDSIRNGKVDLFDRVPVKESPLVRVARLAGALAAFVFVNLIVAPIGVVYHLSLGIKHAVLLIFRGGERWNQAGQSATHIASAFRDALHFVPSLFAGGAAAASGLLASAAAVIAITLVMGFFATGEVRNLTESINERMDREDRYGFYKSALLRDQFGLVSQQTGGLLHWDPKKDSDVITSPNAYGYGRSYRLEGYFADLHTQQAEKLLNTVHSLQALLPSNGKIPFSYPPEAKKIAAWIKANPASLSSGEVGNWQKKLLAQEENMKSVWNIISASYTASTKERSSVNNGMTITTTIRTFTLPEKFPLPESACRPYFQ